MPDFFAWSIPLGRLFGITVRVHWFFPFVAVGLILSQALYKPTPEYVPIPGAWVDVAFLMGVFFVSVLLHELAHCFAARAVDGEASEVLLWPLGGLTQPELPARPRALFLTALAGPLLNLLIAAGAALLLLIVAERPYQPIWNPLPGAAPIRDRDGKIELATWAKKEDRKDEKPVKKDEEKPAKADDKGAKKDEESKPEPTTAVAWVARVCWANWFLFAVNVVLVGFPLDGARLLQSGLWWWTRDYPRATLTVVFAGFAVVFVVGLYAIVMNNVLAVCLALIVYVLSQRQWVVLETGGEEGGVFGYDFSQGYTSLERDQPTSPAAAAKPKVSWWRRWLQKRAAKRMQRELEEREAEERRLDELLDKVHREGQASLTDEERRFMKRVSDRYRHRR